MFEMLFIALVLAAVLEAAVKTIDRLIGIGISIFKDGKLTRPMISKLILIAASVTLCLVTKIPVLDTIAKPIFGEDFTFGATGYILTGLVLGRGSNVVHSLIEKIKGWSNPVSS